MKKCLSFLFVVAAAVGIAVSAGAQCYEIGPVIPSPYPGVPVMICMQEQYYDQVVSMVQFDRKKYYLVIGHLRTIEGDHLFEVFVTLGEPGSGYEEVVAQTGFFGSQAQIPGGIDVLNSVLAERIKPIRQSDARALPFESLHLSVGTGGVAVER